ncbi:hypothetical protein [Hyphomonas sp.]|uniref:hypothetical protein n=1 Tax=Hyphomonas sp. TaxID=87 RepID=UPI003340AEA1
MITRLVSGALILWVSACAALGVPAPAAEPWACRDAVRSAAIHAYALARNRDDQRAVILLPAGQGAADYEKETQRLRSKGARLLDLLKQYDAEADKLSAPARPAASELNAERVAARIEAADACAAKDGK